PTPDPEAQLLSQADLEFMKNRVKILVLGIDESTERANWGSFRTDTMILVTVDFATNDVHMVSIPRDSYVKIANGKGSVVTKDGLPQFAKINSAFPTGGGAQKNGYEYAMGTVSYLFGGIPVHYYLGFNMNVVKEVVNAMGGVDYNVDVEVNMNGRQLHPGMQHMDGQAVLDYARQRKGSSDIARVDRQQRIIMAIFGQLKSTGQIQNIPQIYQAVEENIQTNLSFRQITSLALLALQMDQSQLYKHTVDGEFLNMYTVSYWGVSTSKLNKLIEEVFGVSVSTDADVNVSNIKAQIEANRALIAVELQAANDAVSLADGILAQYGAWLSEDTQAQLKSAKSQLEDAVDMEDKEQLDYYTPPLAELCNQILAALGNAGAMPGTAPAAAEPAPDANGIPEIPEVPAG
ncbi:MAG TPA: LCP family protein, partial [Feifaniaceae bacterium]|nr:LCP family protein [Feifaniaceae bacterium]